MFKHFLRTTFRNMIQNKSYVIINVLGLGIALACVIVAYSFFKFDWDFDDLQTNKEVIYKVSITKDVNGNRRTYGITPASLGPAMKNSLSGIDNIVRYDAAYLPLRYGENIFDKKIAFVDTDYFEVFELPMIAGNKDAIKEKENILMGERFAKILFGDQDPINQIITIYSESGDHFFKVAGVFKDIPENQSMEFEVLTAIENNFEIFNIQEHAWTSWVDATFLKVSDPGRIPMINEQLKSFIEIHNDAKKDWLIESFYTESFSDIPGNHKMYSYHLKLGQGIEGALFVGVLAIIILLLACLNFMNTFLAISNGRLKEIGINKVLGGIRRHSIFQFLGESIILCFIALFFALTIAPFLLDEWNTLTGMELSMNFFNNLGFWIFLVLLLLFTGIVAGAYPAFYISSFNPVKILKGSAKYRAGGWFSKTLLAIQFLLAIIGNVAAVMFIQNANYQENLYLGYNKERIIIVPENSSSQLFVFKNKISQNPLINKMGLTDDHIGRSGNTQVLKYETDELQVKVLDIGRGYFETMELELTDGRYFDQDFKETERGKAIIVNKKLVKDYGWESGIGKRLRLNDSTEYTIIGEMKDFYLDGFGDFIKPTAFKLGAIDKMDILVVDTDFEKLDQLNSAMKEEWEKLIPNKPYPGYTQFSKFESTNKDHQSIVKIFLFIGIISVILSLVGLYSLISLNIIKKTREIGIRKVMGAPMPRMIRLISKEFIFIVIIGSILGAVLGSLLTFALLDGIFVYHIGFNIWGLIIPVVSILIISIVTLSGKIYLAASRNPVDSLKYE